MASFHPTTFMILIKIIFIGTNDAKNQQLSSSLQWIDDVVNGDVSIGENPTK